MKLKKLVVLVAEDNEDEAFLLDRAVNKLSDKPIVRIVENGGEAIAYLRGEGKYADRNQYPFPNVLIVDLKMPVVSGMEVLKWLHDHEECAVIPSIVLSASADPRDIKQSYVYAANAFFTKPNDFESLVKLLATVFEYWFTAHVPDPPPQSKCR
jgi:CheY-like chemotaxis protein